MSAGTPNLRPSRHHGTPQPLAPSSKFLRYQRVEAGIVGQRTNRAGETINVEVVTGRFETAADARTWADRVHPDADVHLTKLSERDGWQRHAIGQRRGGVWS